MDNLLEVRNLAVSFTDELGGEAVRGISFGMAPGERLGIVGESGSGKTMTALAIAGLLTRSKTRAEGEIIFAGTNLLEISREKMRTIQGRKIGFVFQEPMTSLNPLMKVGLQVEEALLIHTALSPAERRERALRALREAELGDAETAYAKYPHELSGGQRQRALIAAAMVADPSLIIADEPTTALDVTVQAQILKLFQKISEERGMALLFISHDLRLVRRLCPRVLVMRGGEIVERGETDSVFSNPQHEYTKTLVKSAPGGKMRRERGQNNGQRA